MSNPMRIEKHRQVRQAMREAYKRGDFAEVDRIRYKILASVSRKANSKSRKRAIENPESNQ